MRAANGRGATATFLALVGLGAALCGCGFVPWVGNDSLHVVNSTTIPVTVTVNGREMAVVEAGQTADFGPADLGAQPWRAQALTSGGRELTSLDVEPGSVHDEPNLDGTGTYTGVGARADLTCGQIRLYAGRIMPGGPAPGPGTPGDCDP